MNQIQRYSEYRGGLETRADGNYVKYFDYQNLLAKLEQIEKNSISRGIHEVRMKIAEQENEKLNKEIESLKLNRVHTCHDECPIVECVQGRVIEKLKKCVEFYSQENNWDEIWLDSPDGNDDNSGDCSCRIDLEDVEIKTDDDGSIYYSCGGKLARQTLKELESK